MMSRILAIAISVTLVLSMGTGVYATVKITDIEGHRSEAIILEAIELGVIKGYPDGTYKPSGVIKREEFFSIINNVLTDKPDITDTKLDFIDVDPIEWYVPIVKTMVEGKITEGIGWGKVGIGLNITRQEAVKILATIISTESVDTKEINVLAKDKSEIASWAYPYYQIMFKKEYLNNTESNLGPTNLLTREEAAILLLKIKKGEQVIAGNADEILNEFPTSGGCITKEGHEAIDGAFTEGKGTSSNPYEIASQDQLNHMRQHANDSEYFILTKDIKMTKDFETSSVDFSSDKADWSGGNFRPIGSEANQFNGNFNGKGFKISGLNIIGTVKSSEIENARVLTDNTGFVGFLNKGGIVSNLMIDDSTVYGREYTGSIVGYSEGSISNCGVGEDVKIRGGNFTGGIAGFSNKIIENSYSIGEVTGTTALGALIGRNYGVLRNSYWLDENISASVGSSSMDSSISNVVLMTRQEFDEQKIEEIVKPN